MTDRSRELPWLEALAGVLGVAIALAVNLLLDGLSVTIPSLVISVGDVVIDSAPSAVEQWAIATLGTYDKPALIIGILVISAAIGAGLGMVGRRRFGVAVAGFVVFGMLGGWAAATTAPAWGAWSAAVVSVAAGLGGLRMLLAALNDDAPTGSRSATASDGSRPAHGDPTALRGSVDEATADTGRGPGSPRPTVADENRRAFLRTAGWLGAAIAVAAAGGRYLLARAGPAGAPRVGGVALPAPTLTAPDIGPAVSFDVEGLHPWITPNTEFFRIDTALRVPRIDTTDWSVAITGMVDRPLELTYDQLLAMPLEEHLITLACVSNEVGGDLVDNASWLGVRLDALLERAGVQPGADQIVGRSVDGFSAGFPTEVAFDGRDALVAVAMNGEPLPAEHGYPSTADRARPVRLRLRHQMARPPWQPAELAAPHNDDTWRQWLYRWDARPGTHRLTVRATDGYDELQLAEASPVAPAGATGLHTITLDVT